MDIIEAMKKAGKSGKIWRENEWYIDLCTKTICRVDGVRVDHIEMTMIDLRHLFANDWQALEEPLKQKDLVTLELREGIGTVLAIHEGKAWVKWYSTGAPLSTYKLSDLKRVKNKVD